MRFYLDENLSPAIVAAAEDLGVDIVSTHAIGRAGANDTAQLMWAAEEGRCLVTMDYDDFGALTRLFMARRLPHAGVLFVSPSLARSSFRAIARALSHYARAHPGDLPAYMVDWLRPAPDDS